MQILFHGSGIGLEFCIPDKCLDAAAAAGLPAILGEASLGSRAWQMEAADQMQPVPVFLRAKGGFSIFK